MRQRENSHLIRLILEPNWGTERGNTAGNGCYCRGQQNIFYINVIMISDNDLKRTSDNHNTYILATYPMK